MFYFSSPTSGIVSVTLPVGVYSMTALNSTIQQLMQNAGYYNTAAGAAGVVSEVGSVVYNVNLSTNTAANRTVLQIRFGSGYTVYFNQPNTFWNLLGFYSTDVITDPFPNATSPVNGYYYSATFSENQINILNNILQVNIGCTLAEGSIYVTNNNSLNSINSIYLNQIIAYKPYIDPPGSILAIIPATPIKIKITEASKNLRNFTVFCVDNNLKPQNFNSNQFAMNLLIEQV
jgi:hypothetical protein